MRIRIRISLHSRSRYAREEPAVQAKRTETTIESISIQKDPWPPTKSRNCKKNYTDFVPTADN